MIRMKLITCLIFTLAVLIAPMAAMAQDVQVTLSVDQEPVIAGQPFLITATITDLRRAATAERPSQPNFGQLQVLGGPQVSSQVTIVNGVFSSQRSYTWQVMAPNEGTYEVGPSQVTVGGQAIASNTLTINAGKGVSASLPPSLQGETILPPVSGNPEIDKALAGKIFLRAQVSTKTPYVSQPVIVKYVLVKDPNIRPQSYGEVAAQIQGALSEELYHARAVNFTPVPIDGMNFEQAHILSLAVVPTKPGEFSSPGYAMEVTVPVRRRRSPANMDDPFDMMQRMMDDDPFFGGGRAVRIPSPDIKLNVRPLPEVGKPADFSGTVGDYTLTASVDRTNASQDDLITLSLTLVGIGAIELASAPVFDDPNFEVVGRDHKVTKNNSPESLGGTHEFQFVLSPKRAGQITFPAVRYSIFDPGKEEYRTLETQPIALNIAPGTRARVAPVVGQPAAPAVNAPSTAPPTLDNLHYIRPTGELRRHAAPVLLTSSALWAAQIAAAAIFLLSWWRRRVLVRRDPAQHRRRGAWRNFEKRLAAIQRESARADSQESAHRLEAATRACIADYFNLSPEGLTRQEIERLLGEQAVGQDRIKRVCDLLDQCAAVRYAPAAAGGGDVKEWGEEMGTLLKECFAR